MTDESLVPAVEHCERLKYFGEQDWKNVKNIWREYSLNNKNRWICCVNDENLDIKLLIPAGQITNTLPAPTTEELIGKFNKPLKIKRLRNGQFHVEYELMPSQGMFNIQKTLPDALADLWVQLRKQKYL